MYDTEKTTAQLIREAIASNGMKLKDFAKILGKTPAALSTQLNTNRISANEWRRMAHLAGYEVVMIPVDANPIGKAPKIQRVIDGVTYSTKRATPICYSSSKDGWVKELYLAHDGETYFLAHFLRLTDYADEKTQFLTIVSKEYAELFIKKYRSEE